jgi:hypothetical protein
MDEQGKNMNNPDRGIKSLYQGFEIVRCGGLLSTHSSQSRAIGERPQSTQVGRRTSEQEFQKAVIRMIGARDNRDGRDAQ